MRTVRNKLGLAAIVAITAGTLFALVTRDQPPASPMSTPAVAQPARPGLQWLQATGPARAPVAAAAPMPLAAQIDRLVATRNPAHAYAAYRLLADCAAFNRDGDRIVFDAEDNEKLPAMRALTAAEKAHDAVLCAGMTERMRQSRLDYLALAARAGVPGAAVAMAIEGPFGDITALATRPGDPLVQQWQADVNAQLARAAEHGELDVLHYLTGMRKSGDALFSGDAAAAYRYGLALGMIERQVNGPDDVIGRLYRADSALMREMAAELSEEQRAAAVTDAGRIAEAHRARQKPAGADRHPREGEGL